MEHIMPSQLYNMIKNGEREITKKIIHFEFKNDESIIEFIKHVWFLVEKKDDKITIENCSIKLYNILHFQLLLETELFYFRDISIVPRIFGIDHIFIKKEYF